jgi:pilus assembly protein Flp/PilA
MTYEGTVVTVPIMIMRSPVEPETGAVGMNNFSYWQYFVSHHVRARFGDNERGASLVEYALLVALIAVVCLVAIAFLGSSASQRFSNVGSAVGAS